MRSAAALLVGIGAFLALAVGANAPAQAQLVAGVSAETFPTANNPDGTWVNYNSGAFNNSGRIPGPGGSYSLKTNETLRGQITSIVSGLAYSITWYYKTLSGGTMTAVFFNSPNSTSPISVGAVSTPTNDGNNWTKVVTTFTAPSGSLYVAFTAGQCNGESACYNLDDIGIKAVPIPVVGAGMGWLFGIPAVFVTLRRNKRKALA